MTTTTTTTTGPGTGSGTSDRPRRLPGATYRRRGTTRRSLALALALAATLSATAGACRSEDEESSLPDRLTDNRPLVVAGNAASTSAKGRDVLREMIDRWNEQDGVRPAELVRLPQDVDAQRSHLIATLQSGQADYDVLMLDPPWIPEFAEAGLIRPLDAALLDPVFTAGAEESAEWDGEVYAVPFITDVGLLFYRTDVLADQGVSEDDLRNAESMAGLLGRFNEAEDLPSYVTQLAPYEGLTVNTLEAFWSTGIDLVDEEGDWAGSSEALREGLATLENIADEGKTSELADEANEPAALQEFMEPGTAMMRGWPDSYHQLPAGQGYGVTALPGSTALGGRSLAIAAEGEHAEDGEGDQDVRDAEELIRFLTHDRANQKALLEAGSPAALRAAYELPAPEGRLCREPPSVLRPAGADEETRDAAQAREVKDAERTFNNLLWCALREARSRPETENYAAFSQTLQGEVHDMITQESVSPDQVAGCLEVLLPLTLRGEPLEEDNSVDACAY
ncbi:extracellular solute-binding protein [Streptomyces sp. 4N509B]|uniref:extracellular solute-binding protein n=1 Tax=Streptomyces sp. 4N509B TaxID=3457413 RepID=UPI003FD5D321